MRTNKTLHSFSFILFALCRNITTLKDITKVERDNSKLNYSSDKKYVCKVTKVVVKKTALKKQMRARDICRLL